MRKRGREELVSTSVEILLCMWMRHELTHIQLQEIWKSDQVVRLTLGNHRFVELVGDILKDAGSFDASLFLNLKSGSIEGPFLYSEERHLAKAQYLRNDPNYICVYQK